MSVRHIMPMLQFAARLAGGELDLAGANLRGADLTGADLCLVDWYGALRGGGES